MAKPTVLEHILDRYEDAIDRLASTRVAFNEEKSERIRAEAAHDDAIARLRASQSAGAAAEKAAAEWKQKALTLAAENANLKKLIPVENLPIGPTPPIPSDDTPILLDAQERKPTDPTVNLPF